MRRNILFIILFFSISVSFSQTDTILVLFRKNSLGGEILDTGRHYTIWQKHYANVISGNIKHVGDQCFMLDTQKILLRHISKIRINLDKNEKNRMRLLGFGGTAVSVTMAFVAPYIDIFAVPFTISAFLTKGTVYRIPEWRLMSVIVNERNNIIVKEKYNTLKKFIIFNNLDTVHKHSISVNPVKLLDNTIAFSFESKSGRRSKTGHEFEAGYIYPDVNIYGFINDAYNSIPNYYYRGFTAGYFFKKYRYAIRPSGITLNYFGLGLQYKNMSFQNEWYYGHDDNHPYDSYVSQQKDVISMSLRNGITIRKDESLIEYFMGIGCRISFNDTQYHFYKSHTSNTTYAGHPPYDRPANDDGAYISPFISMGIKFGLSW